MEGQEKELNTKKVVQNTEQEILESWSWNRRIVQFY